tara:strand:+ start:35925 stop:37235 length:1311 start_codon:yes stop_codon:yes gene_type:complete
MNNRTAHKVCTYTIPRVLKHALTRCLLVGEINYNNTKSIADFAADHIGANTTLHQLQYLIDYYYARGVRSTRLDCELVTVGLYAKYGINLIDHPNGVIKGNLYELDHGIRLYDLMSAAIKNRNLQAIDWIINKHNIILSAYKSMLYRYDLHQYIENVPPIYARSDLNYRYCMLKCKNGDVSLDDIPLENIMAWRNEIYTVAALSGHNHILRKLHQLTRSYGNRCKRYSILAAIVSGKKSTIDLAIKMGANDEYCGTDYNMRCFLNYARVKCIKYTLKQFILRDISIPLLSGYFTRSGHPRLSKIIRPFQEALRLDQLENAYVRTCMGACLGIVHDDLHYCMNILLYASESIVEELLQLIVYSVTPYRRHFGERTLTVNNYKIFRSSVPHVLENASTATTDLIEHFLLTRSPEFMSKFNYQSINEEVKYWLRINHQV